MDAYDANDAIDRDQLDRWVVACQALLAVNALQQEQGLTHPAGASGRLRLFAPFASAPDGTDLWSPVVSAAVQLQVEVEEHVANNGSLRRRRDDDRLAEWCWGTMLATGKGPKEVAHELDRRQVRADSGEMTRLLLGSLVQRSSREHPTDAQDKATRRLMWVNKAASRSASNFDRWKGVVALQAWPGIQRVAMKVDAAWSTAIGDGWSLLTAGRTESSSVVVLPDATTPALDFLHSLWRLGYMGKFGIGGPRVNLADRALFRLARMLNSTATVLADSAPDDNRPSRGTGIHLIFEPGILMTIVPLYCLDPLDLDWLAGNVGDYRYQAESSDEDEAHLHAFMSVVESDPFGRAVARKWKRWCVDMLKECHCDTRRWNPEARCEIHKLADAVAASMAELRQQIVDEAEHPWST